MSVNNQMYMLFKKMKDAYKNEKYDVMESSARNWLLLDPENPFAPNSPEHEAFFQMQRCFIIWRNGDINGRINKRKMVEWAKELCKIDPKQPYKFDKKAAEEEAKAAQEIKPQEIKKEEPKEQPKVEQTVIEEEPKKVFGVIPEERKSWFKFVFPWKKEGGSNDSSRSD